MAIAVAVKAGVGSFGPEIERHGGRGAAITPPQCCVLLLLPIHDLAERGAEASVEAACEIGVDRRGTSVLDAAEVAAGASHEIAFDGGLEAEEVGRTRTGEVCRARSAVTRRRCCGGEGRCCLSVRELPAAAAALLACLKETVNLPPGIKLERHDEVGAL